MKRKRQKKAQPPRKKTLDERMAPEFMTEAELTAEEQAFCAWQEAFSRYGERIAEARAASVVADQAAQAARATAQRAGDAYRDAHHANGRAIEALHEAERLRVAWSDAVWRATHEGEPPDEDYYPLGSLAAPAAASEVRP